MAKSHSISALLRLPRELRDEIYNYALHEPSGLYYQRTGLYGAQFTRKSDGIRAAFNQLQFINRQLRQETQHLEHRLNTLIFPQLIQEDGKMVSKCPAVQFMGFLELCNEPTRRRLQNIRLHYNERFPKPECPVRFLPIDAVHNGDLLNVAFFCEEYPNVTVWWHTRALTSRCHSHDPRMTVRQTVLEAGLMLTGALRPGYDVFAAYRELRMPVRDFYAWNTVFHSCRCRLNVCWYNHRSKGYVREPCGNFTGERETYLEGQNFRWLPDMEPGWEEEYREEEKGIAEEIVDKRMQKIREFVTIGI
jgi:hypothetical protein